MSFVEYKITVLGGAGVGKTSIIRRFVHDAFILGCRASIHNQSYTKKFYVDGQLYNLKILDAVDTHDTTDYLLDFELRKSQGIVLAYSVISFESFKRAIEKYKQILYAKSFNGGDPPMVLVGTMCERESEREVTTEQGKELAKEFGCPFIETSASRSIRINDIFIQVVRSFIANSSEPEPEKRNKEVGEKEGEEAENSKPNTKKYRIFFCGDTEVGKTAIVQRFAEDLSCEEYTPTIKRSYTKVFEIDGQECTLEIDDASGDSGFYVLHKQFIKSGQGFVLVYSVISQDSFSKVNEKYEYILRQKEAKGVPIVLVGNKCDLERYRVVTTEQGEELARQLNCPFFETSASNCIHVEDVFIGIVREIESHKAHKAPTKKEGWLFKFFRMK